MADSGGGSQGRIAVLAQVYYEDLWPEIAAGLRSVPDGDIFVSLVEEHFTERFPEEIRAEFPGAVITTAPNRGFDVGPFVDQVSRLDLARYELVCKIHTKRGGTPGVYPDGGEWRRSMLEVLLGSAARIAHVFELFRRNPDIGMIGSAAHLNNFSMGGNADQYQQLCDRLGIPVGHQGLRFFAGTIFWCRAALLRPLQDLGLTLDDFEPSKGADGQRAHAIERVLGALVISQGYYLLGID